MLEDGDIEALEDQYSTPLWEAVGETKPKTLEDAVKGLRHVLIAYRDQVGLDSLEPEEVGLIGASTYRLVENVLEYFEGTLRREQRAEIDRKMAQVEARH